MGVNCNAGYSVTQAREIGEPTSTWWCPTGPLAFLPIHAAGHYDINGSDCIFDYVISSYTPSLTALLAPPFELPTAADPLKMTAVIQPHTAGYSSLPSTIDELKKIEARVPRQWLTSLGGISPALVDTVLDYLRTSSIVHFACHGTQDVENPIKSALLLSDGPLQVSQIMQKPEPSGERISNVSEQGKSLVFLSACETAKGYDKLPDEAMHLAATLLFAGFRGAVATMWSITDEDGPTIADAFYEHLFKNSDATSDPPVFPDLTEAARALHLAVAELRKDKSVSFARWVPFVHFGM